jgi:hypothetical protein
VGELIPRHLEVEEAPLSGLDPSRRVRLAEDLSALLSDLEARAP